MKIDLPNVCNARDLGHTVTKYGIIKPKSLIRSGVLNRLTDADVKMLADLKLRRVVDLRTGMEIDNAPDVAMQNVEHVNIPIVQSVTFGISFESLDGLTMATRLQAGYERMKAKGEDYPTHMRAVYYKYVNDEFCRNGYGKFLKLLSKPVDGATLWHCTMGKDRCGTCAALLEYCLGASMEQIVEYFMESNRQTRENTNSVMHTAMPYVDKSQLELINMMFMVQPYYFEAFFGEINAKFGSVDNFIKACGVTNEDINNLRKNYLI